MEIDYKAMAQEHRGVIVRLQKRLWQEQERWHWTEFIVGMLLALVILSM